MLATQTNPVLCCVMLLLNLSFSSQFNGRLSDQKGTSHTFDEEMRGKFCFMICVVDAYSRALHSSNPDLGKDRYNKAVEKTFFNKVTRYS